MTIQRVPELVPRREDTIRKFLTSRRPDDLTPVGQPVAKKFNLVRLELERRAYGPDGELLSSHAGAFQRELLGRAQALELDVEHIVESIRHAGIDIFKSGCKRPLSVNLSNQAI